MAQKKQSSAYAQKLKDPRWQKRRLEILSRDEFTCQMCFDSESTLVVHHRYYVWGREPWDYNDDFLVTLCQDCHEAEHECKASADDLVKVLRLAGFFDRDIAEIARWFAAGPLVHVPEVVASAICNVISDVGRQQAFIDDYFRQLKERNPPSTRPELVRLKDTMPEGANG